MENYFREDGEYDFRFSCPHCKHITIASKEFYIDWDSLSPSARVYGVALPCLKDRSDRRCLICGKFFIFKQSSTYEEAKDVEK